MDYNKKIEQIKTDTSENFSNQSSPSTDSLMKVVEQLKNTPSSTTDFFESDNLPKEILETYSDDKIPSPVRKAQMETFQLIDTIKVLKDTIETFSPVLQEGKKIMSLFENMKI
jgi:hypothetical protein